MESQQSYKRRIASTTSLKKIFNAQELIAASRIAKARKFAELAKPYSNVLTKAMFAITTNSNVRHPITVQKKLKKGVQGQTAILVLAADRGMAGAYTMQVLRETKKLYDKIRDFGKEPKLFVFGKRAISYYSFNDIEVEDSWHGSSDAPPPELANTISKSILSYYLDPKSNIDEVFIVYTKFKNMVSQEVKIKRMLPMLIEEKPQKPQSMPLYEFEPSESEVLNTVLPVYFRSRINYYLLESAASETASRRRAMHTATENATELIDTLITKSNQARQTAITNELSEIVGSANALEKKE